MEIDITASPTEVVIGASGLAGIYQNIRTILATRKGSVPLDRDFGVDQVWLDEPTPLLKAQALPAIVEAIEKYEPRAKVVSVRWIQSAVVDGVMTPSIRIRINDEYK